MRELPSSEQKIFDTALRWMEENVIVAGGVYRSRANRLRVARSIRLTREGQVKPWTWEKPSDWSGGMLNSTLALTCCCYIAALGKVASEGDTERCDRAIFESFIDRYMKDFNRESKSLKDTVAALGIAEKHAPHVLRRRRCSFSGGNAATAAFYKVYRCGFVHSFWPRDGVLVRMGTSRPYWYTPGEKPHLNVDRLAWGLLQGIERVRADFQQRAEKSPNAFRHFVTCLMQ